jgi:hypothetical protein
VLNECHPTSASKNNRRMADGLQGLWLNRGSLGWRFDGFSGVRASFHSVTVIRLVTLTLTGLSYRICALEKTTASGEAKSIRKRWNKMLWIVVAASLFAVALLIVLRHRARKSIEKDIAF